MISDETRHKAGLVFFSLVVLFFFGAATACFVLAFDAFKSGEEPAIVIGLISLISAFGLSAITWDCIVDLVKFSKR